uniref:Chromo domain protein n=1 Tax=Rhizophora mucronata TaxID=61149 RepID=A0A2P2LHY0_RHIMU
MAIGCLKFHHLQDHQIVVKIDSPALTAAFPKNQRYSTHFFRADFDLHLGSCLKMAEEDAWKALHFQAQ